MHSIIRYRAGFGGCLVLQVKDGQWRDARLKDLLFEKPDRAQMTEEDIIDLTRMITRAGELFPGKDFQEIFDLALKGQNAETKSSS